MHPRAGLVLVVAGASLVAGCEPGVPSPSADAVNRGRVVWMTRCTSCHHVDPAKAGTLGPPVQGASRELLEARVLRAAYPAGYTPKRATTLMQPLPDLAGSLDDLGAFLASTGGAP